MIRFKKPPSIVATAAVGGKKEGKGPYGKKFDAIFEDELLGSENWEQAEAELQKYSTKKHHCDPMLCSPVTCKVSVRLPLQMPEILEYLLSECLAPAPPSLKRLPPPHVL